MPFTLTIAEAADRLGISRSRMYQLVENGDLPAEKIGGIWFVDDVSVEDRLENPPSPGRPPKQATETCTADTHRYTLMNRTYVVLDFSYDDATDTFVDVNNVMDSRRAPFGLVSRRGGKPSKSALERWWARRAVPSTRPGINTRLEELGMHDSYQLPFENYGLSLSDQYWIRPKDSEATWEEINYFQNEFVGEHYTETLLEGLGLKSPDNTSEGQLSKCWIFHNNKSTLYKSGSTLGQEPYNEAVATALHRRILEPGDYVPYRLETLNGETVSACDNFVNSHEEYIPSFYVSRIARKPTFRNDYQHYLECCASLGVKDTELAMSKTIVCDSIIGNFDRHTRNFGLIRNVDNMEYRNAPIFDSGGSLWCNATMDKLRRRDYSFLTKPFYTDANRQLRLVNDYSWFNIEALEGFPDEVHSILSPNAQIAERIDYICEGVAERIEKIRNMM